jgi:diguanylate cyclase (GGDEF)-like protein/PAS domain S-box-containing protein
MKLPLRARILAGFLLAFAVLACTSIMLYRSGFAFQLKRPQVGRARDAIEALGAFRATLQDAETGQRGYLITGNESYLQPYLDAKTVVGARLGAIEGFVSADPADRSLVAELRKHTDAKMAELERTIKVRREQGKVAAEALVATNEGKNEMDAARSITNELLQRQRLKLVNARNSSDESVVSMERMFGVAILVQCILFTCLFLLIYRDAVFRSEITQRMAQESGRLHAVVNTIGDGLYQLDRTGMVTFLNPAAEHMLGYRLEEIRGTSMHALFHTQTPNGDTHSAEDCPLMAVLDTGRTFHCPHDWFSRKDGSLIAVEYTNSPILRKAEVHGSVLSFQDITERLNMEQALQDSEERYRNQVENSHGLMCTHDQEGNLLSVNKPAAEALGYTVEDARNMNLRQIVSPAVRDKFEHYLQTIFDKGSFSGLMRLRKATGEDAVWSVSNRVIQVPGGSPYVLGHAIDVTAQVAAQEALKKSEEKLQDALEREKSLSRIDFLTKISNRRAFYETVDTEAYRSRRYNRPMTLIYIDVDNFKHVNDSLGHHVGDELLAGVAATIQERIRQSDMVARLGGDEFGVLLPETPEDAAAIVVKKIHGALRQVVQRKQWPVTFSIGMITFVNPLQSVDDMIKGVDDMMYEVKRGSKDAVSARVV